MSTSFFCSPQAQSRKNHRRICPISHDLIPVDSLGTPASRLLTGRSS